MKCRVTVQLTNGDIVEGLWDAYTAQELDTVLNEFAQLHDGMTIGVTTERVEDRAVKIYVTDRHAMTVQFEIEGIEEDGADDQQPPGN